MDAIHTLGDNFLFLGDGVAVHQEKLTALLGRAALFAPAHAAYLRPACVAWLASQATEEESYQTLQPMYLRAPSAERNKKLLEALHANL